jgi:hypothetical protein
MKQQHTQFVVVIVDTYAPMVLDQMSHKFSIEFLNLTVSKTAFCNHAYKYYVLSFKRLEIFLKKFRSEALAKSSITRMNVR